MHRIPLTFFIGVTVCIGNLGLAQEMPTNLREQIEKHYIGDWEFSMKGADATFQGTYTATWAPGNHCVMVHDVATGPQGKVHTTGILAWQPDTKTVVHHGFISNGDYFRILYDRFEGNQWSGRVTGLVNGKRAEDSDAVVVWHQDRIVYEDAIYRFVAE